MNGITSERSGNRGAKDWSLVCVVCDVCVVVCGVLVLEADFCQRVLESARLLSVLQRAFPQKLLSFTSFLVEVNKNHLLFQKTRDTG